MKKALFQFVRRCHVLLLKKPLPDRFAIYFHALEKADYDVFSEAINFLRDQGYEFCSIENFLLEDKLKKIYISFDDNYQSWYLALSLFERLDLSCAFYVNSLPFRDYASEAEIRSYYDKLAYHGSRVSLSSDELRALLDAGHTIGCHTHSHLMLTGLPLESAKAEILRGKERLEQILGVEVFHFSYPFGMRRHFSGELRNYCSEIGFRTIANAIPCLQYAKQSFLNINRSPWRFDKPLEYNAMNIRIDGRFFESVTGRSAAG